jgi:hypothetical protein
MAQNNQSPFFIVRSRADHIKIRICCTFDKISIGRDNRICVKNKSNAGNENIKRIYPVSCYCLLCPDTARDLVRKGG